MEQSNRNLDQVLDEFLGGEPRAEELHEMASVLANRLTARREELRELSEGSVEWDLLNEEVQDLEQKVRVLRQEEAVNRFVEESIRMTLGAGELLSGGEEYEPRDLEEDAGWRASGFPELDEEEE